MKLILQGFPQNIVAEPEFNEQNAATTELQRRPPPLALRR